MPTTLGPDTVQLVLRSYITGQFNEYNQPAYTEASIDKTGCLITVGDGSTVSTNVAAAVGIGAADTAKGSVQVFVMKGVLPIDDDTRLLTGNDGLIHDGILYELNRPPSTKTFHDGSPSHFRVFGSSMDDTMKNAERVTVQPRGGRDDDGQPKPDGQPFDVTAYAVSQDKSDIRFWSSGSLDTAEFMVALPVTVPISDNDYVTVRGRQGYARVRADMERWENRNLKMVEVTSALGGKG